MSGTKKQNSVSLSYLVLLFSKVGSISFGGFMALVAVLQKEIVDKDKNLKDHVLLDGISLASLLPGPVAVNVVGYVGNYLRGFWGAIVSMAAVIFPSFILVLGFSIFYFEFGSIDKFQKVVGYLIPAIIIIILTVGINMSRKQIHTWAQYVIGFVSLILFQWIGGIIITVGVIFTGGLLGYFLNYNKDEKNEVKPALNIKLPKELLVGTGSILILLGACFLLIYIFGGKAFFKLNSQLFLTFSGMSLSLFGGGYVFIPIIQETVVNQLNWLTSNEFNTAIAISQITPGPILISATFIGYKVAGIIGAIMATIGIFLPSGLVMVALSGYLKQISDSRQIKAVFKGLRPAIIGLIFSAGITIFRQSNLNASFLLIFIITFILALKYKLSTIWVMLISIGLGLFADFIL